jgi:hypothetical protein
MNLVAIHAQSPEVQCPNCREAMRTGVPNIYVFYCQRCQHVDGKGGKSRRLRLMRAAAKALFNCNADNE